jgi:hypothetical protein
LGLGSGGAEEGDADRARLRRASLVLERWRNELPTISGLKERGTYGRPHVCLNRSLSSRRTVPLDRN